jgi:plasmid stability protein
MSIMIQIRHVPDEIHRTLKSRAAKAGMSLSDYLLAELRQIAERPTMEEMRERLRQLPTVHLDPSPTQLIREERDRR